MKALNRAKEILLYSDSEPNELLIGILHALILPVAMLELGKPWLVLQLLGSAVGVFQLYAVLYNGSLRIRKLAVKAAIVVAISTVVHYTLAGMMCGSHFGWLLILGFAVWNLIRVHQEELHGNNRL